MKLESSRSCSQATLKTNGVFLFVLEEVSGIYYLFILKI
ncbi:hypothetical protein JCM19301_3879 [Jejuia pallidilutea]|uniref:Uncharacterized protein n=1 Tax=Jejuia pallidilutea TaxID=504487 RepID=A0A090VQ23_9FLAO|nr:hypothetical protein JCM19301_3879 [Jejuia pallidilutea]GAL89021.1 hypothetical protein JCM19538_2010 [Jejuia pallidilutea]